MPGVSRGLSNYPNVRTTILVDVDKNWFTSFLVEFWLLKIEKILLQARINLIKQNVERKKSFYSLSLTMFMIIHFTGIATSYCLLISFKRQYSTYGISSTF